MSTSTEPNYWHPETSDIKDAYLYANGVKSTDTPDRIADVGAEFDLWLAEHDRQMRAEALREASEAVNTKAGFLELLSRSDGPIWREQFAAWLRKRAGWRRRHCHHRTRAWLQRWTTVQQRH
jgi:hypothetical protein